MEVPAFTTTNLLALRCVLIFLICAVLPSRHGAVTSAVAALRDVFAGAALLLGATLAEPRHSFAPETSATVGLCEPCNHAN